MNTHLPDYLSVSASDVNKMDTATAFADRHQLTFVAVPHHAATPYVLDFGAPVVSLLQLGKGSPGPINASFLAGNVAHRQQYGGGRGQLIAKAVGVQGRIVPQVLDATAGLGRDAFVLATLGCHVHMLERSPVVATLLESALDEARATDDADVASIVARMRLTRGSAQEVMQAHVASLQSTAEDDASSARWLADVVYLDPMYPPSGKSALVKKEMRAFHDLVGGDEDADALLALALQCARCRVVVKRPKTGAPLQGQAPTLQVKGKRGRYDVYTLRSLNILKATDATDSV